MLIDFPSWKSAFYRLTRAAEYKDNETGAHVRRISFYTKTLAEKLGLDAAFVETIFYASPMHDVGKIGIPDHILLKPGIPYAGRMGDHEDPPHPWR